MSINVALAFMKTFSLMHQLIKLVLSRGSFKVQIKELRKGGTFSVHSIIPIFYGSHLRIAL